MSFLRKLLGKKESSREIPEAKEPTQAPKSLDVRTAAGIETMLRAHLERLQSAYGDRPGAEDLRRLCSQLLANDQLAFVVKSIQENLPRALAKKTPYDTTNLFTLC